MGVIYVAVPVDSVIREWLNSLGIPAPVSDGRAPTSDQLQTVLESLPDHVAHFNICPNDWQADIESRDPSDSESGTTMNVRGVSTPGRHCEFSFSKGSPELIIRVAHRISQVTGPIVIIPDSDREPAVVEPDSDVDEIIRTWRHFRG